MSATLYQSSLSSEYSIPGIRQARPSRTEAGSNFRRPITKLCLPPLQRPSSQAATPEVKVLVVSPPVVKVLPVNVPLVNVLPVNVPCPINERPPCESVSGESSGEGSCR